MLTLPSHQRFNVEEDEKEYRGIILVLIGTGFSNVFATDPEDLVDIFEGCVEIGNPNCGSNVWGSVNTEENPWVLSAELGWLYLHPDTKADGYYIWIQNIGWIYSSQGSLPIAYNYTTNTWIVLDLTEKVWESGPYRLKGILSGTRTMGPYRGFISALLERRGGLFWDTLLPG